LDNITAPFTDYEAICARHTGFGAIGEQKDATADPLVAPRCASIQDKKLEI
jgi:hypothetical protein